MKKPEEEHGGKADQRVYGVKVYRFLDCVCISVRAKVARKLQEGWQLLLPCSERGPHLPVVTSSVAGTEKILKTKKIGEQKASGEVSGNFLGEQNKK